MTADQFRKLALALPETGERAHMNHPDFRVRGKIFATLAAPEGELGMVKLTPEEQQNYLAAAPDAFTPAAGAWGRQGCTMVRLKLAGAPLVARAMETAWQTALQAAAAAKPRGSRAPRTLARAAGSRRRAPRAD